MPFSLTSVPKKAVNNQNRFTKCKQCLTNPTAFYNEVTDVEDKEGGLDAAYLAFNKAFDIISHSLLITKLVRYELDK